MLGKTNGGGGGFDPSEIQSGTIAVDNILGLDTLGSIVKGNLDGQYVKVIPAPESNTLTNDQFNLFKEGVFVNGTFLGMRNPIFLPCSMKSGSSYYRGVAFGQNAVGTPSRYTNFCIYSINSSSKAIESGNIPISIENETGKINLENLSIESKSWPAYPTTNTTPKVLQIASNGGSLSWGDVPSPAVVAYEGTSLLPTDVVFEDWTLHRAIKDGNVLWFVLTGKLKNNGASSVNVSNICEIVLPSEVSSKIYRLEGTTCDSAYTTDTLISRTSGIFGSSSTVRYTLLSTEANKIKLQSATNEIPAGNSLPVDMRIPIFLDTGTVS